MEIIPKVHDRIIYIENDQRIAICAYQGQNCDINTENVFNTSKTKKEALFDAYVLFDINNNKIIEKYNVFIEDFQTIAYVRISNLSDENGDSLELCHYIEAPKQETHSKMLFAIVFSCIAVATIYLAYRLKPTSIDPDEQKDSTTVVKQDPPMQTPAIDICNNLASKGYLSFSIPKNVMAKMYVSPNLKASNKSIAWDEVTTYITPSDTLYPKKDCKIFIHAYFDKTSESTYTDYEFVFNMKEFVQFAVLGLTNDKKNLGAVARQILYNVSEKRPITFDIGGGIEPTVITSIYDLKQISDYISQDMENFKIDSVGFHPYVKPIKGATIFSKEYPCLKYIRLK